MIDYELAKRLKDAGFPQQTLGSYFHKRIGGFTVRQDSEDIACPTLSELIEACGMRFNSLHRLGNGQWCSDSSLVGKHDNHFSSITPEEAVAKLWLALNKKK